MNNKLRYTVSMPEPASHFFNVEIELSELSPDTHTIDLKLPVWRPGRYFIFDFASGIQEFKAFGPDGSALVWEKTDKLTWKIQKNNHKSIKVSYRVFANDFLARTRGLNEEHAFINATAVLMFAPSMYYAPLTLKVNPYVGWHVTTGLKRISENEFFAPNYDYFTDCPLEIGKQIDHDFEVAGIKHTISIFGKANYDLKKMTEDFTKIILKNFEFWGRVPYERYTFIVHCTPQSGGGTEHINSTVVGVKPQAFETEAGYEAFLRLISHEFFHTWNVKQLKPAGITPYDFTKENYLKELWVAEGGTSYYDGLMLVRTGQMSIESFYKEITVGVEDERRRPGNKIQSLAESSFDAWVKFWRRSQNHYISESDYYSKGSYVSLLLDLEIMNATEARYSLDDVFRVMFELYPLDVAGYTNEEFREVCEEFTGTSLQKFFDDYITGTNPLDWEKYLSYAGLILESDEGTLPVVGLYTAKQGEKIVVNSVLEESSASKAGLKTGDEIVACNGSKCGYEEMEKRIKEMKAGTSVEFFVFREDKLVKAVLTLEDSKLKHYSLKKMENPTDLQRRIYDKWLETKW
ncbi:MAG: M61 family metallopeptidase [Ignavibacteria bacterium]|nr:M61 family metallopeptidase [Ignavibacteria bacterium]